MNKGHQTATRTHTRRFVDESRSFIFQVSERGLNVRNLDCNMVHSRSVFSEKLSYGRVGTQRLEQLDVSIADCEHANPDALLFDLFCRINL